MLYTKSYCSKHTQINTSLNTTLFSSAAKLARQKKIEQQLFEVGDVNHTGVLASEGKDNFQSQLLDWRMSLTEIDTKINGIVEHLTLQLEALLQTMKEHIERNLNRLIEVNAAFERSTSSVQRFDLLDIRSPTWPGNMKLIRSKKDIFCITTKQ